MDRATKREYERETDKIIKKYNKLPSNIKNIVDEMTSIMIERRLGNTFDGIDRNITAAVILNGGTYKEAEETSRLTGELMYEDTEKLRNLEGDKMTMKQIEKEVRSEIENILQEGLKRKDAIGRLVFKFPKLSKSMLTCAYQQMKEEKANKNKKDEADHDVEEAAEKIMDIIEGNSKPKEIEISEENIEEYSEASRGSNLEKKAEEIIEGAKEVQCNKLAEIEEKEQLEKDRQALIKESSLKVLSKELSMVFQGENGKYIACSEGIELKNEGSKISFGNEEDVDKWADEVKEVIRVYRRNACI